MLTDDIDNWSPANGDMFVSRAQANFMKFGACSMEVLEHTRGPLPEEEKDPEWKPLSEAVELFEAERRK